MSLSILGAILAMTQPKPNVADLIARSWNETLVVGHRGAAAYKPENTISAFQEAIASGAHATECDVRLSKDGEIVIMHDARLDRTTTLKGLVKETPLATMKTAGIPTLDDVTQITRDRIVSVVEIKEGVGIEQKVVDHLNRQDLRDQSIIFSFGAGHIAKIKELDPKFFAVWLVGKKLNKGELDSTFAEAATMRADGLGFAYTNVVPEILQEARKRRLPVFVWTVPPGEEVDKLKALRVNFIITDHPRDVWKQLKGG